jgi:FkbM family methyltransferase
MSKQQANERYARALEALRTGEPRKAEGLLHETLDGAPRAAQSLYLLGVSLLAQGRWDVGRRVVDEAYRIKPWLRDLAPGDYDLTALAEEGVARAPEWLWPRYELERHAWFAVGLTLDTIVTRHLGHDGVFFVEIGANDGVSSDPIHEHVRAHGWSGICVEPLEGPFAGLVDVYRDQPAVRCVNAALSESTGTATMRVAANSRLASLLPDRNALTRQADTRDVTVPTTTFDELLAGTDRAVDLLQIDTEGYDYQVLRMFDLERRHPLVVNMEFYCLPLDERLSTFRMLRDAGYAYHFDGMDLVALSRAEARPGFLIHDQTAGEYLLPAAQPAVPAAATA